MEGPTPGLYHDPRGSDHRAERARGTAHASRILEGTFELLIQGQPTRRSRVAMHSSFRPRPHAGGKPSDVKVRVLSTYVVEKGKPLTSPAGAALVQRVPLIVEAVNRLK